MWREISRVALIVLMATLLLWISVGVTMTLALGEQDPDRALNWWPAGADSHAAASAALVTPEATSADLVRAKALARAALRREPINITAARTLGLATAGLGDANGAAKALAYSDRSRDGTCRRSFGRSSMPSRTTISPARSSITTTHCAPTPAPRMCFFPVLVAASDDEPVTGEMVKLLGQSPSWGRAFLGAAVHNSKNSQALVAVARAVRLDMSDHADRLLAQTIIWRLAEERHYALAADYYGVLRM